MYEYRYKILYYSGEKSTFDRVNFIASSKKVADQMANIYQEKNFVNLVYTSKSPFKNTDITPMQAESEQFKWLESLFPHRLDA